MTPSTDRLHKFLVTGGIALLAIAFTYPAQKYDDAARQVIEAGGRLEHAQNALARFGDAIAYQKRLLAAEIRNGGGVSESRVQTKQFDEQAPKTDSVMRDAVDMRIDAGVAISLAAHSNLMAKYWSWSGGLCLVLGGVLIGIGFRQWLCEPKETR